MENMPKYLVFNKYMRRIFIKAHLDTMKGYFESMNPEVVVNWERKDAIKNGFAYKLELSPNCEDYDKQKFNEVFDAMRNVMDYFFNGNEHIDVCLTGENAHAEWEIYSDF